MSRQQQKWEEEFDEKFELIDDMDWDRDLQGEVKTFIKSIIQDLEQEKMKNKIRSKLKHLFIKLAHRFNCHDSCDLEVPCHCNFCGEPNTRYHDKTCPIINKNE